MPVSWTGAAQQPQQIRIVPGGVWHKRRSGNGRNATACGIHFHPELVPATREAQLDDLICRACHTWHEVETAELHKLEREAVEAEGVFEPLGERLARRERAKDEREALVASLDDDHDDDAED